MDKAFEDLYVVYDRNKEAGRALVQQYPRLLRLPELGRTWEEVLEVTDRNAVSARSLVQQYPRLLASKVVKEAHASLVGVVGSKEETWRLVQMGPRLLCASEIDDCFAVLTQLTGKNEKARAIVFHEWEVLTLSGEQLRENIKMLARLMGNGIDEARALAELETSTRPKGLIKLTKIGRQDALGWQTCRRFV
eukprot:g1789.t1